MKVLIILALLTSRTNCFDVPHRHEACVQFSNPELKLTSASDNQTCCWGYERNCQVQHRFGRTTQNCNTNKQLDDFWRIADFGYIGDRKKEEIMLCKPNHDHDSYLKCSKYTRYCNARNMYLDFADLKQNDGREKFREDLFDTGQIGGFCDLDEKQLSLQSEHKSSLQSWYAELQNFTALSFRPLQQTEHCDVIVNKTVVFMKLDFGGNMFHHFCDFFNLYISQHYNGSWFGKDIQIVMWDTATTHYWDPFSLSWDVFTSHPVLPLLEWSGKRVCIRDVMFPLLPRMRSGLYYNSYIPPSCSGSNLFRAFSQHFLHRIGIKQHGPLIENNKPIVRVTLLQRGNPENDNVYRQIKNQHELVEVLKSFKDVQVKVVEYDWRVMGFKEQLEITHNSDIFIGMHGAGLTHFLFLPDWAVAFELYNCHDKNCYCDLARLRGVHYITWPEDETYKPIPSDQGKHYRYGDNPKFWNWSFDPGKFRELISQAKRKVLGHDKFARFFKNQKNEL